MRIGTLALSFLVGLSSACHRKPKQAAPAQPAAAAEEARQHGQGALEAGLVDSSDSDDEDGGGSGSGKYRDPVIYVDGEARASFTYNEMPSSVKVLERHYEDDGLTYHMLVCDYFHALGVDCASIKETQWYSGKGRVAVITGKELQRFSKTLYFNFTKGTSGKPRVEWQHAEKLHTTNRPDLVADVCIYVHKKPPVWDIAKWALVDDKGEEIEGIPYSHDDGKRGVRVDVDGRLAGRIKRNLIEGNIDPIDENAAEPRYRLADFLASRNIKVGAIRGIDLLVREERIIRLSKEEVMGGVTFSAAKHHHGEMMFFFGKHYVPALAVEIWSRTEAPARPMRTVTLGVATSDRGAQSPDNGALHSIKSNI